MKHLTSIFFALLLSITFGYSQSEADKEKAIEYAREAVMKIDKGEFAEAHELLDKSVKLDPKNSIFTYEIAYIYYVQKEYKKVIPIIKKDIKKKEVTDQHYQLLGNSYDLLGQTDKALKVYQQGVEAFPNSGKLYLEQGVVEVSREKVNEAVAYWEKGVEVDPSYPSNYYWLAKVFSQTDERIWAVIYGEIFLNLERNSRRTAEMSEILYKTYQSSIDISSDTSAGVSFSREMTISADGEFKIPFPMNFEMIMSMSLTPLLLNAKENKELTIKSIDEVRQLFVKYWFENDATKDTKIVLFDFHKKLKEKDFFEAYNYWFLMKGDVGEFEEWFKKNEEKFNAFVEWFTKNPLEIDKNNYFSRLKM